MVRILTNRNFPGKAWEAIEKNGELFMWVGEDYYPSGKPACGFGFPVDEEFVKEKFIECGREYKRQ